MPRRSRTTTNATATVSVTALDVNGVPAGGARRRRRAWRQGNTRSSSTGSDSRTALYTIVIVATGANGISVTQQVQVAVSRTLAAASLAPALLTPNGDGSGDRLSVTFQLAAPATVRLRVLRDGKWVATPFTGTLAAGPQAIGWDGTRRSGSTPDGSYTAVLDATDAIGTSEASLPFRLDARPPVLKLLLRPLRLWVSEPATVTVRVNGSLRRLSTAAPGTLPLTGIRVVRTLVAVARDEARNTTVFRRPARP